MEWMMEIQQTTTNIPTPAEKKLNIALTNIERSYVGDNMVLGWSYPTTLSFNDILTRTQCKQVQVEMREPYIA